MRQLEHILPEHILPEVCETTCTHSTTNCLANFTGALYSKFTMTVSTGIWNWLASISSLYCHTGCK